jgi:hypothetical protein
MPTPPRIADLRADLVARLAAEEIDPEEFGRGIAVIEAAERVAQRASQLLATVLDQDGERRRTVPTARTAERAKEKDQ